MKELTRIIGVDPGSRVTGYGIIETDGVRHRYISSGYIKLVEDDFTQRLGKVFFEVSEVIAQWKPVTMGIEKVFVNKNFDSALKLAQARSAVICACMNAKLDIGEYSPRSIKKSVVGSGAADKQQIQSMMQMLLKLESLPQADEADALAIAICHANHMNVKQLGIAQGISRGRWV